MIPEWGVSKAHVSREEGDTFQHCTNHVIVSWIDPLLNSRWVKDAINSAIPLLTAQVISPLILCPNNGGSFISVTFMCVRTSTPYFILQCHSSARSTRLFFPYSENIPFAALIGLHLPCLVSLCTFIFILCLGYASASWEAKERSRLVPK